MNHKGDTKLMSFWQYVCSAQIVIDEMSLTLEEAHNILFRWDLNAKYVWEFHKILMSSIQNFQNNFVFYHAFLIMKYLDNVTDVSDKIYVRVIQTFMVYEKWTKNVFTFINLSHTVSEECNINFNDIYKMITQNFLKELLKEEMKKVKPEMLSNWNKEIEIHNLYDEELYVTLNELIFTKFLSFKKYYSEFVSYMSYSALTNNHFNFIPDIIEIQFKDFF